MYQTNIVYSFIYFNFVILNVNGSTFDSRGMNINITRNTKHLYLFISKSSVRTIQNGNLIKL